MRRANVAVAVACSPRWWLASLLILTLAAWSPPLAQAQSDIKWDQPPVLGGEPQNLYYGWNEPSIYGGQQIAADDWVCAGEYPVAEIHWWGSFAGWTGTMLPSDRPLGFHLAFWTDMPAGNPDNFSHPGRLVWEYWCTDYQADFVGWDYDPRTESWEACFLFHCILPPDAWFYQPGAETIYWLSVAAGYEVMPDHEFGWKTRPRDAYSLAPDAAVRIFDPTMPGWGSSWGTGEPIYWPEDDPEAQWDLAFYLEGPPSNRQTKWYQPPEPYFPADGFYGWNEWSQYGGEQIVADDWVCTTSDAVVRIEWWGSFIGWSHAEPPRMPDAFWLTIWTDVPAGVDNEFSHPGDVIWAYHCESFQWEFAGWDIDPRDPFAAPEACYHFTCDLPRGAWFEQPPGEHIYWLSVAADEPFGPSDYPFGWKTRPRDPESLAPDDGVLIWDPTAPVVGDYYMAGSPLWWPTPEDSWDLAFRLIGQPLEPNDLEPKWHQDLYPPPEGFDAISNIWFTITSPPEEVNLVVADDFVSDGRDIRAVQWFGSYWDDRYAPDTPNVEPYVLDGWLIGIHWAKDDFPGCPPDLMYDPPPTVLAVYFAPAEAVQIGPLDCTDCFGHALYDYRVDLRDCCLVCTMPDPRTGYAPPGMPGAFQEVAGLRYWLSIQAVVGMRWDPETCEPIPTDHMPPLDVDPEGRFWGWHNGIEEVWPDALDEACVGQILDVTPYPPDCWNYGNWFKQPWLCDSQPYRVNMAFTLLAPRCPEDFDGDGVIGLSDLAIFLASYGACYGQPNYSAQLDLDNDGCIGLSDLAMLLSVYGTECP